MRKWTLLVALPLVLPASAQIMVPVGAGGAGTVTTTGSPASGNLAKFSGASSVTNGDLTGAVTTSGGVATTIATSLALPGSPTTTTQATSDNSTKVATTAYVTTAVANAVAGVNPAVAVQAATTAAGDTSGLTYNNGVSGIGATFTGSVNTALTVDGYTFTAVGQRLLVKNDTQSPSGAFNGVYYVTQVQTGILPPILTRALDYDTPSDINNTGAIPVINGTVNGTTQWVIASTVNTVGTDPLTFTKFSSNPSTLVSTITTSSPNLSIAGSGTSAVTVDTTQITNPQTGTSYTLLSTDLAKIVTFTNASATALTVPTAGTTGFESGKSFGLVNIGAGLVTVTTTTSAFRGTPGNITSFTMPKGTACWITSDGSNWIAESCTAVNVSNLGTSGGIPYYASGTTTASSAALAANALVIGGGAGTTPSTTTTGTGVLTALGVNTGTAGSFLINGSLAPPPQYVANNFYFPSVTIPTSGSTVFSITETRYFPLYIAKPMTISQLCVLVTTQSAAGSGTDVAQIAIYGNSATNLPTGAPLVQTANMATTATGTVCATASYAFATAGLYWEAFQIDNTVARLGGNVAGSNNGVGFIAGANAIADLWTATGAVTWSTTSTTYGTFGTNPTVTEANAGNVSPQAAFKVASVP